MKPFKREVEGASGKRREISSLGMSTMTLIPVPDKDFNVVASISKMRTLVMPLELKRLAMVDGGGSWLLVTPP